VVTCRSRFPGEMEGKKGKCSGRLTESVLGEGGEGGAGVSLGDVAVLVELGEGVVVLLDVGGGWLYREGAHWRLGLSLRFGVGEWSGGICGGAQEGNLVVAPAASLRPAAAWCFVCWGLYLGLWPRLVCDRAFSARRIGGCVCGFTLPHPTRSGRALRQCGVLFVGGCT